MTHPNTIELPATTIEVGHTIEVLHILEEDRLIITKAQPGSQRHTYALEVEKLARVSGWAIAAHHNAGRAIHRPGDNIDRLEDELHRPLGRRKLPKGPTIEQAQAHHKTIGDPP